MTPRILISGCNESRFNYENAVIQCGGTPESYYLPPLDLSCDGLLLCGGNDVAPEFYAEENISCQELDTQRDRIELELCRKYLEQGKPILGICRGMQLMNVALGGSLQQDIGPRLHLFHSSWEKPDYRVHPVCAEKDSILGQLYGESFPVNSCHHQALKELGKGLKATAWAESGIVEAVEHESLPVLAVQYHPEQMCFLKSRPDTADGSGIFRWFLSACSAQK